jgi:uncharacterized hydrophobic protein (TIGR00271 family)
LSSSFQGFRSRISLFRGTDREGTVERLTAGAKLNPANSWLLVCSAILASIGLDVSSPAVIIGAMLISPLMGPILGVGLGMGITDRALLQHSLRELAFATVFCLVASGLYFLISPLATPTPELIARTRPTLLDVGVAFFGGVAGIVAGSRREQNLVTLPGVAIATALMPPLCAAGFGLATASWTFFFGAFYLYILNALFIALATFLVVRVLRFPRHELPAVEEQRRERQMVAGVTLLAILPSVYFLYDAVQEVRERNRMGSFVEREIEGPGRAAEWAHRHTASPETLKVYVVGRPIEPERADSIRKSLAGYGLGTMELELVQSDVSAEDLTRFQGELQRDVLHVVTTTLAARDSAVAQRQREDSLRPTAIAREVASAFPEMERISFTPKLDLLAPDSLPSPPAFLVWFRSGIDAAARRDLLTRAEALVRSRYGSETIRVVGQE